MKRGWPSFHTTRLWGEKEKARQGERGREGDKEKGQMPSITRGRRCSRGCGGLCMRRHMHCKWPRTKRDSQAWEDCVRTRRNSKSCVKTNKNVHARVRARAWRRRMEAGQRYRQRQVEGGKLLSSERERERRQRDRERGGPHVPLTRQICHVDQHVFPCPGADLLQCDWSLLGRSAVTSSRPAQHPPRSGLYRSAPCVDVQPTQKNPKQTKRCSAK